MQHQQRVLQRYINTQERDYEKFLSDSALIRKLVQQTETLEEFKKVEAKKFGFYIYAETISGQQDLLFWNDQKSIPPAENNALADGEYFQQLPNGYYLTIKKKLKLSGMSNTLVSYALIPVLYYYELESTYLRNHFVHDAEAYKKITLSPQKTNYGIRSLHGKVLFYITPKAYTSGVNTDNFTITLRITALILFLLYLHFSVEAISRKRGPITGIVFLTGVLVILRVLLYLFKSWLGFNQFQLFNPTVYGSAGTLHQSLGDLLLNVITISWILVYAWYNISLNKKLPGWLEGKRLLVAGITALLLYVIITFQLADIIKSLVADSTISFDVTDFFNLSIYSAIGFVVLALMALAYYYCTRLLFKIVFPAFDKHSFYIYFIIGLAGLLLLTFQPSRQAVLFHLPVLLWLLIYTFLFSEEDFLIDRFKLTVAGILFWIFIFSVSLSIIILNANRNKEWAKRKQIAERLDQQTDPSNERILSIALAYLDNRFFVNNFDRFTDPVQNRLLRDSVINVNFSGYNSRYNTRIYLFDSTNHGVYNDEPTSYAELNSIFTNKSRPTTTPDLYYHEISYEKFLYITKREITDSTGLLGTFFIVSTPKQYSTDALYPELFRRVNKLDVESLPNYSYAIYSNGLLIRSSNKYPFVIRLRNSQIPVNEYTRKINDDYEELWYKASNSKIVVVVKKRDSLIESITLFSYMFCSFLFTVSLLRIVTLLLKISTDRDVIKGLWQLNIRSQVHNTIIFISLLSFLIIGVATISFFISRYNRNNIDKISRTAQIMTREMQKPIGTDSTYNDAIRMYDTAKSYTLQRLINEVADVHGSEINIYSLQGDLIVTSNSDVYKNGILSNKMHPEAYFHLARLNEVQYVHEEVLYPLHYLSIYAAIRDENGFVKAYLNVPYFMSEIDLNQEISNFLVTIINLNAFIFLIAGVIALFITNKITRSFSVIGDKMKAITLGKTNEEIVWARDDEIGELIKQYNKMVHQLELSAEALARSEREGAWREMARQVAHEIKNPLTPMKLSIQYLQRAINNNQSNIKELTGNVANTLIEQIDHLSKIAADFSQFANIGNKHIEVFDLHDVLENLKDLYSTNPTITIIWQMVAGEVMMEADKTHMNRLFTNLLSNAIDACSEKESCRIDIVEEREESTIVIEIADNGEGIPADMQSKIFTPNFTTKTSGTGLGLAMCKSIVEHAGGQIWFETKQGKGTSFFVRLPII